MVYAEGTTVSVERSIQEAQSLLRKHGVTDMGVTITNAGGRIQFRTAERAVQFTVLSPAPDDAAVRLYASGKPRPASDRAKRSQQVERERWRALVLTLKAKLESVEAGVETVEQAFLAQILLPDGSTVADQVAPALERAYSTGVTANLLQLES